MKNKLYYVSFKTINVNGIEDFDPDGKYYNAKNDDEAVGKALEYAKEGDDYRGIGHVDLEVLQVTRHDKETYEELETIYINH